jgi:hypothetical protein
MLREPVAHTWWKAARSVERILYTCLSQLGLFAGFVAETTTFIAECAEDESDLVVKETHRLKNAVESVAGKING